MNVVCCETAIRPEWRQSGTARCVLKTSPMTPKVSWRALATNGMAYLRLPRRLHVAARGYRSRIAMVRVGAIANK